MHVVSYSFASPFWLRRIRCGCLGLFQSLAASACDGREKKGTRPGGALGYLGGRIRSLSKFKNTPKALISDQKSTLILVKTLTFSTK